MSEISSPSAPILEVAAPPIIEAGSVSGLRARFGAIAEAPTRAKAFPFSASSAARLAECDIRLQLVIAHLALYNDIVVVTGYRGQAAQEAAFRAGHSKVRYPNGSHNLFPSMAVDIQPVTGGRLTRFALGAKAVLLGQMYRIPLRWGGDFNNDSNLDQKEFEDPYHLEIRRNTDGSFPSPTPHQIRLWASTTGGRLIAYSPEPWRSELTRLFQLR